MFEKIKQFQQERQVLKDELAREQADRATSAGRLATSGVFGVATIELYEGGYVRIASPGPDASTVSPITKKTRYERLVSATFTPPESETQQAQQAATGGVEGATGQVVAAIFRGGSAAMKSTIPGLAATGVGQFAKVMTRKAVLTIVTDQEIHTLNNLVANSVGIKVPKADQIEVARHLAASAAQIVQATAPVAVAAVTPVADATVPAFKSVSDRLRELAVLHSEGILGDEEYASAKAKVLADF